MTHQFDELAKALAEDVSRREALRRIGGTVAGALLVSLGLTRQAWGDTRAACKSLCGGLGKYGKQCMDVCSSCSSASCVGGPAGAKTCLQCTGGKVCSSGTCQCPVTKADCGGVCVDTATDATNCGVCGKVCSGDKTVCSAGSCVCASGKTDCSGTCVDTSTDPKNCGGCGVVCSSYTQSCQGSCTCNNPQHVSCSTGQGSWCCPGATPTLKAFVGCRAASSTSNCSSGSGLECVYEDGNVWWCAA